MILFVIFFILFFTTLTTIKQDFPKIENIKIITAYLPNEKISTTYFKFNVNDPVFSFSRLLFPRVSHTYFGVTFLFVCFYGLNFGLNFYQIHIQNMKVLFLYIIFNYHSHV